jgi:hypothetical protein
MCTAQYPGSSSFQLYAIVALILLLTWSPGSAFCSANILVMVFLVDRTGRFDGFADTFNCPSPNNFLLRRAD